MQPAKLGQSQDKTPAKSSAEPATAWPQNSARLDPDRDGSGSDDEGGSDSDEDDSDKKSKKSDKSEDSGW